MGICPLRPQDAQNKARSLLGPVLRVLSCFFSGWVCSPQNGWKAVKPVLPREVALCSQRPPPAEPWVWGAPRLLASVGGARHGNPTSCTGWPPHKLDQGHVLELSRCPSQPPEFWAIVLFVWSGLSPFSSELITMELARSASFWMKNVGCTWRQHAGVGVSP